MTDFLIMLALVNAVLLPMFAWAFWYGQRDYREESRSFGTRGPYSSGCEGIIRAIGPEVPSPNGDGSCIFWCHVYTETIAPSSFGGPFIVEPADGRPILVLANKEANWTDINSGWAPARAEKSVFRDGDLVHVSGRFDFCEPPAELASGYRGDASTIDAMRGEIYRVTHGTRRAEHLRSLVFLGWIFGGIEALMVAIFVLVYLFPGSG
jgi:hypothetical protein